MNARQTLGVGFYFGRNSGKFKCLLDKRLLVVIGKYGVCFTSVCEKIPWNGISLIALYVAAIRFYVYRTKPSNPFPDRFLVSVVKRPAGQTLTFL